MWANAGATGPITCSNAARYCCAWVGGRKMGRPVVFNKQIALAAFGHGGDRGGETKMRGIAPCIHEPFDVMAAQGLLATDQHAQPDKLVRVDD